MTLPEGRTPLGAEDMAKMHPSTWAEEVCQLKAEAKALRETLSAIIAATDMSQTKHRPEVIVQIIRHLARAALKEGE